MEIKGREDKDFFYYSRQIFSKIKTIFHSKKNQKKVWIIFLASFFLLGFILGLIFSGFFGTFDQPSGKAYSLLSNIGIKDPHNLKLFFEGSLKENVKIPYNWARGQLSKSKSMYINIDFENYQKIEYKRQKAIELGTLVSSGEDYVPATIVYEGEKYDVKLRLKGDLPDHWEGDKWSFRIKVENDKTIMGTSVFSIQDPRTRQEINERIYQDSLKNEGVIGLRYHFLEVFINGENKGIYAFEEHFSKELIENNSRREGVIVKFSEDFSFEKSAKTENLEIDLVEDFYRSPVTVFENEQKLLSDPVRSKQFKKAVGLLENLRNGTLKPSEVLDVDKTAKYYALSTAMNCPHSRVWHNVRLYYNPVTSLLEPIGFDGNCRREGGQEALLEYSPQCIAFKNDSSCLFETADFSELVLRDPIIFKAYIQNLERMSEKEYLDNLFSGLESEIKKDVILIQKEKPFYHFSKEGYYSSQNQISYMLHPLQAVNAHFEEIDPSNNLLKVSVGNLVSLPVEIDSINFGPYVFFLNTGENALLQPRNLSQLPEYRGLEFVIPSKIYLENISKFELEVNYKIFGTNNFKNSSILPWGYVEEDFVEEDFIRQKPNLSSFEILEVNDALKKIEFVKGDLELSRDLIIPENYLVYIHAGTNLDLKNGSMILSYSGLNIEGSPSEKVKIFSSDGTGQGITVLGSKSKTFIKNAHFDGMGMPDKNGWQLLGSLNFHETSVQIQDVSITNTRSEDGVNIINSKFSIKNLSMDTTGLGLNEDHGDCIDSDFSEGTIDDSRFLNCKNDGLDFSGSLVNITNSFVLDQGDKGISAGERSLIFVENSSVKGGFKKIPVGIASKDFSRIYLKNTKIANSEYGIICYQKKQEYGPAIVIASKIHLEGVDKKYLVEEDSELHVDGTIILSKENKIYEKLYG